jgi:hypothetical protein
VSPPVLRWGSAEHSSGDQRVQVVLGLVLSADCTSGRQEMKYAARKATKAVLWRGLRAERKPAGTWLAAMPPVCIAETPVGTARSHTMICCREESAAAAVGLPPCRYAMSATRACRVSK